jgi:hypothetical protein
MATQITGPIIIAPGVQWWYGFGAEYYQYSIAVYDEHGNAIGSTVDFGTDQVLVTARPEIHEPNWALSTLSTTVLTDVKDPGTAGTMYRHLYQILVENVSSKAVKFYCVGTGVS